jgi:hypothetical protein
LGDRLEEQLETSIPGMRGIASGADDSSPTQRLSDGISPVLKILETIQSGGPMSISLLSLRTRLPLPSLIRSLNKLERMGFVKIDPDSMLFSVGNPLKKASF